MKIQDQLLKVVLSLLLLMCLNPMTGAQQPPEQELPRLSAPVHAALYPEVMCVGCVVPIWDDGYLVHVEFDRDPAVVTMYEGRSFVGVEDFCDQEKKITHGLYELNAKSGTSVAKVIPVEGTISKCDPNEIAPAGAFFYLWGADGNELVVQRQGDGLGLSWARVSASVTTVQ